MAFIGHLRPRADRDRDRGWRALPSRDRHVSQAFAAGIRTLGEAATLTSVKRTPAATTPAVWFPGPAGQQAADDLLIFRVRGPSQNRRHARGSAMSCGFRVVARDGVEPPPTSLQPDIPHRIRMDSRDELQQQLAATTHRWPRSGEAWRLPSRMDTALRCPLRRFVSMRLAARVHKRLHRRTGRLFRSGGGALSALSSSSLQK